jgi:tetratricopeptide (TPR) repeat protein
MIRSFALPGLAAALIAVGALYAADRSGSPTGWTGLFERPADAKTALEDLPICTTMATIGSDVDGTELDSDFKVGKKALAAQDWNGAIAALKLAALRDPRNADIQNYIGYAYRRLHQLGPAMGHYQQALTFNPRHRSAHEHLGELFLVLGEPDKAQEHLETLARICLVSCEELGDLERLIVAYRTYAAR